MTGASETVLRRAKSAFPQNLHSPDTSCWILPRCGSDDTEAPVRSGTTGRVLGAQAAGGAGVDKRIDILAVAIQAKMTVFDLEEMEFSAPSLLHQMFANSPKYSWSSL